MGIGGDCEHSDGCGGGDSISVVVFRDGVGLSALGGVSFVRLRLHFYEREDGW